MESLTEIIVALVSGFAGVLIFRFLNPKTTVKENQQVIVKVNEIAAKNDELLNAGDKILKDADKKAEELEKEKNKDVTNKEMEDFFNSRKDIQ